jgi:hypothetical protein
MGNYLSIDFCFQPHFGYSWDKPLCVICKKKIDNCDLVTCLRCNITLHYECEENHNPHEGRQLYTKCPKCHRIGTLGFSFEK